MNVYILVDRTGSMAVRWSETINAVNSYVNDLVEKKVKKLRINIAAFDTQDFTELRRNVKKKNWKPLNEDEVYPRSFTNLFDAIGKISEWVETDNPDQATLVVVTDGAENSSREYTKEQARAVIDRFKNRNYDVVFLGADFDAFAEAGNVGVAMGATLNMTAGNYGAAMRGLASKTVAYASTGRARDWTDQERAEAAGEKSSS